MQSETPRSRLGSAKRTIEVRLAWILIATVFILALPLHGSGVARDVRTNEAYINALSQSPAIDANDLMAVFTTILSALPNEVKVYPTENYYYFTFFNDGIEFAGNFRLDASDRDSGVLHFAYFTAYAQWNQELVSNYKALTVEDSVTLERVDSLTYRASHDGKSVTFKLNDLSDVRPPTGALSPDEKYLGPVFDESGVEMYLVFNKELNIFHYILNETGSAADTLTPSAVSDRIWIGHRSGFAFYSDRLRNRKILIGVFNGNSLVNNYFDGPFDQLPDNFIKGDELKEALEAAFPSIKGKIDRFGNAEGGQTRILITPYMHYDAQYELQYFSDCAEASVGDDNVYYRCFAIEEADDVDTNEDAVIEPETNSQASPSDEN